MAAVERSWFSYWKENMEALGFVIPSSLVLSEGMVLGFVSAIVAALEKFGPRVTIGELVGAGLLGEQLMFLGALSAAGFAGAAIGSAAVATGRSLSGGTSLSDVLEYAMANRVLTPQTRQVLSHQPQIYQQNHPARRAYATGVRI
jgi:hypothetical protein